MAIRIREKLSAICKSIKPKSAYDYGIWIWGTIGVCIGCIGIIYIFCNWGDGDGVATVLAALIATTGVVWSWFFQLSMTDRHHKQKIEKNGE